MADRYTTNRLNSGLSWADVTPKEVFLNRRQWLAGSGAMALAATLPRQAQARIEAAKSRYSTDEAPKPDTISCVRWTKCSARRARSLTTACWRASTASCAARWATPSASA